MGYRGAVEAVAVLSSMLLDKPHKASLGGAAGSTAGNPGKEKH